MTHPSSSHEQTAAEAEQPSDPSRWDFWHEWMRRSQRGPAWRQVGTGALDALEAQVDKGWLSRTIEKYTGAGEDYTLPPFLFLAPVHTIAFAELLELVLRLDILTGKLGTERLCGILDRDPMPYQLMHLRVQLEVGALAMWRRQDVAFERLSSAGGAADVVIGQEPTEIVVETKAVLLDDRTRDHHSATDLILARLHDLEMRYQIECAGDFEEQIEGPDLDSFLISAEICARQAHETGNQQILEAWGARITFSPPGQELLSGLHGAVHHSLGWHRTERILRKKAWQSRHQKSVWLRVDALDGLWQFTPWSRLELPDKLLTLVGPIRQALETDEHVAGVVITSGPAHAQSVFYGESAHLGDSYALRRLIEPLRVRETMIIPLSDRVLEAAEMWRDLYDNESSWLDWALESRGLPTVDEIFSPSGS